MQEKKKPCVVDCLNLVKHAIMIDYENKTLLTYNKENILNPYFIGYNM